MTAVAVGAALEARIEQLEQRVTYLTARTGAGEALSAAGFLQTINPNGSISTPAAVVSGGTGPISMASFTELVNTGTFFQSTGGADPGHVLDPWQPTPLEFGGSFAGSYADSSAGQINQLNAWASNTGTRATVALSGWGLGPHSWGGNFVGLNGSASGGTCWGVEIDTGYYGAGTGNGGALFLVGTTGPQSPGTYIGTAIRIAAANQSFANGIIFRSNAGTQPVAAAGALFTADDAVNCAVGIDLADVPFTLCGGRFATVAGNDALICEADDGVTVGAGTLIQFRASPGAQAQYGIYCSYNGASNAQPISTAILTVQSGLTVATGIDLEMGTYTHAAITLPDTNATGAVRSGANTVYPILSNGNSSFLFAGSGTGNQQFKVWGQFNQSFGPIAGGASTTVTLSDANMDTTGGYQVLGHVLNSAGAAEIIWTVTASAMTSVTIELFNAGAVNATGTFSAAILTFNGTSA